VPTYCALKEQHMHQGWCVEAMAAAVSRCLLLLCSTGTCCHAQPMGMVPQLPSLVMNRKQPVAASPLPGPPTLVTRPCMMRKCGLFTFSCTDWNKSATRLHSGTAQHSKAHMARGRRAAVQQVLISLTHDVGACWGCVGLQEQASAGWVQLEAAQCCHAPALDALWFQTSCCQLQNWRLQAN
jgi:hypothetical protein